MCRNIISFKFNNSSSNKYEQSYLELVSKVINEGEYRCIRGGYVYSIFGTSLTVDIGNYDDNIYHFPLLTHRKVSYRNIIEEILWILRGDTEIKLLRDKGVNIWNGNANKEFLSSRNLLHKIKPGFLGPMYGYQLRYFNAHYDYMDESLMCEHKIKKPGIDQLAQLISKIKRNKFTRTLIMTTFNPVQVDEGCLYPCTGIVIHFHIDNENRLHQIMYQRSCDLLLGVPHNVGIYSVLNYLIASITGLKSGTLKCFLGDTHVYEYHIDIMKKHFANDIINIYDSSKLQIKKVNSLEEVESLTLDDFKCYDYVSSNIRVRYPMFVGGNYGNNNKTDQSNLFTYANYNINK